MLAIRREAHRALMDESFEVPTVDGGLWQPENYDHEFRGEVSVRDALERSLNVPAARLGQRGVELGDHDGIYGV